MPLSTRPLGTTDITVTTLGIGTAPLGGNFADVTHDEALATINAAFTAGVISCA